MEFFNRANDGAAESVGSCLKYIRGRCQDCGGRSMSREKRPGKQVFWVRRMTAQGVWRAGPQQAKKGRSPATPGEFFGDIGTNIHACMHKKAKNDPQNSPNNRRKKKTQNKGKICNKLQK